MVINIIAFMNFQSDKLHDITLLTVMKSSSMVFFCDIAFCPEIIHYHKAILS